MDAQPRKPYPSDLSDLEWAIVEPLLPPPVPAGAPRKVNFREILNAIFYVLSTGCAWSALPHDFPHPEGTVRDYFHQWRRSGRWQQIHDALRSQVRKAAGKEAEPSAGSIDSQTVKATRTSGQRGYDAGKKINGVKRHILVDTLGLCSRWLSIRRTSKTAMGPNWCLPGRNSRGRGRGCNEFGRTVDMRES